MALFGAPIAHEDHAQRGCAAALAMAGALGEVAEGVRRESGLELAVRRGLNSGEVVVGRIGDDPAWTTPPRVTSSASRPGCSSWRRRAASA
jgi:class 3 adenylate cyclase